MANIDQPCITNQRWIEGDVFTDGLNFRKNYFSCGYNYYDGMFNVISFPTGMILYHGSANLADYNSEFPAGLNFYDPNQHNLRVNQDLARNSALSFETLLSNTHQTNKASIAWFSNNDTANLYSANITNPPTLLDTNCLNRCKCVYRLKQKTVFMRLDDDENLAKILIATPLPVNTKMYIITAYGLTDFYQAVNPETAIPNLLDPNIYTTQFVTRRMIQVSDDKFVFRSKNRVSTRESDQHIANELSERIITYSQGRISGIANSYIRSQVHGGEFHQEFIIFNPYNVLERFYKSDRDWQYNQVLEQLPETNIAKRYLEQLDLYIPLNTDFHKGNLLRQSIWSMLWAEYFIGLVENNAFFTPLFANSNQEKLIIDRLISFICFTHKTLIMNHDINTYNRQTKKFIVDINREYCTRGNLFNNPNIVFADTTTEQVENIPMNLFLTAFQIDNNSLQRLRELYFLVCADDQNVINFLHTNNIQGANVDLFIYSYSIIVSSCNLSNNPFGIMRIRGIDTRNNTQLNVSSRYFNFISNRSKQYKGNNQNFDITPNSIINIFVRVKNMYLQQVQQLRVGMAMNYNPKRKTSKRKTSKRKTSKRKTSKRKTSKRKI